MGTFTARVTVVCGAVAGVIMAVAGVVGAAALLVHNTADLRDGFNRF